MNSDSSEPATPVTPTESVTPAKPVSDGSRTSDDAPLDAVVVESTGLLPHQPAESLAASSMKPANWWRDATGRPRIFWRLVLLGFTFLATQIWGAVIVGIVMFGIWVVGSASDQRGSSSSQASAEAFVQWMSEANLMLLVLSAIVVTPVLLGAILLLRRFIDQRSLKSLGFQRAASWRTSVPVGIVVGLALIGIATTIVVQLGGYACERGSWPWQAWVLIPGLVLAAFQEELLIRGYVLRNYVDDDRPVLGLVVSALVFWLLHGLNPAAWQSPWVGVNLVLAGLLLGLMYLLSGNLWFPTAVHFAWNYAQGPLLGIPVSGLRTPSWVQTTVLPDAPHWLTGGAFGLEGSAVCAAVQCVIIALMTILYLRRPVVSVASVVSSVLLCASTLVWLGGPSSLACAAEPDGAPRRLAVDSSSRTCQAIVVPQGPLAHTTQLFPVDAAGKLVGAGDLDAQVARTFDNLALALAAAQSDVPHIVKLNVYVAETPLAERVARWLAQRLKTGHEPAVSYVTTRLPAGALVAMDAVAMVSQGDKGGADDSSGKTMLRRVERLAGAPRATHVAVLPAGSRISIAGQAEKGDLPTATRLTLESLRRTLEFLGQTDADIVQLKSFIKPMSDVARAEAEFAAFFGDRPIPPLVFVEWESSLPIEIELIARAKSPANPATAPAVEYLTPPGMTTSPVYSRVARAHEPRSVFFAGLYARTAGDGAAQVTDIFTQLTELSAQAGTDLKHLTKATYYVSDDDASRKLNELRPKYYDPQRPPAASKAQVIGTGRPDRTITLDMIAVPAR